MKPAIIYGGGLLGFIAAWFVVSKESSKPKVKPVPTIQPPTTLQPGDHLWYWNGLLSASQDIPQYEWFRTTSPNDYGGHGKEIFYFVVLDNEVRQGQPHMKNYPGSFAWMHNNPGNITGPQADIGQYPGKLGWHAFMIFPTMQAGFNAIAKYLRGSARYVGKSIQEAFNIYAPAKDGANNPDQYASEVSIALGLPTTTLIQSLSDSQMFIVQNKIQEIEGAVPGTSYPYGAPQIPAVIRTLLPQQGNV